MDITWDHGNFLQDIDIFGGIRGNAHKKGIKGKSIGDWFMNILENGEINTVFQPIISLKDGSVLGYEALSRGPSDSLFESPVNLFDFARSYGKLWELEFLCKFKALENLAKSKCDINIFLNVDPGIINDEKFKKGFTKEFLKKFNINPENVIFEITEKSSIVDLSSFKKAIGNYKDQGYKIALDDTGSGYSGLKLITDILPHYIKLDMNLIKDIDKNGVKHALIKTLYDFCITTDIKMIAEGIETINELNTLVDLGIQYGQGYFIQRPSSEPGPVNQEIVDIIKERNIKKSRLYFSRPTTVSVGDISLESITISPDYTGKQVLEIFNSNPSVMGLPVVKENKLAGLIMKDKFYSKLGTQYGYSLFPSRPISLIMDNRPLTVDYNTTIDSVAKSATAREGETLYDCIVVTREGRYYGIVSVKDLLEKTIELEVNYAKHLNPLSNLPGNMLIEQKLKELIAGKAPFTVLYIDIDNFKVYNDTYGFENGDKMIQYLARTTNEIILKECSYQSFVGHIGGDDFVAAVESYEVEGLCESLLKAVEKGMDDFYNKEDLDRNFVYAKNRRGEFERFGLATLSIAGLSNKNRTFKDVYELSEQAGKIKKKCKEIWDYSYCIE